MAPKAAKEKLKLALPCGWKAVLPSAVSLLEDSGWRSVEDTAVTVLYDTFKDGGYGLTSLKPPSLLAELGKVKESRFDGKYLLYDGKQCIAALQRIEKEVGEMSPEQREEASWLNPGLQLAVTTGLDMQLSQFDGAHFYLLMHNFSIGTAIPQYLKFVCRESSK